MPDWSIRSSHKEAVLSNKNHPQHLSIRQNQTDHHFPPQRFPAIGNEASQKIYLQLWLLQQKYQRYLPDNRFFRDTEKRYPSG